MCSTPLTVPPEPPVVAALSTVETLAAETAPVVPKVDEPKWKTAEQLGTELAEAHAEIERQHSLFKKAVEECERLNANGTHIQVELKSFQADRQQLKADLAQTRQAAAAAEARASELADTLSAAQEENGALRYQAEVDVNALQERISVVETQLAGREQELQKTKAEHTDALRSLARTRAEFTKTHTEATGLRSEVEVLRNDFETTTQELATTSQQLFNVKGSLEILTEEHQVATAERDDWRQQAEGYRQDLSQIDNGRELLELRAQHTELQSKHQSLEVAMAEQAAAAKKENDVLRGIVERQNATLGTHHGELRRLRRARFSLRLVYGIFSLGLLILAFLAVYIFAPQQLAKVVEQLFGHH
ncbi:MAG: hypothetical protein ACAI37_17420 [Chthoniobacter sp.]